MLSSIQPSENPPSFQHTEAATPAQPTHTNSAFSTSNHSNAPSRLGPRASTLDSPGKVSAKHPHADKNGKYSLHAAKAAKQNSQQS